MSNKTSTHILRVPTTTTTLTIILICSNTTYSEKEKGGEGGRGRKREIDGVYVCMCVCVCVCVCVRERERERERERIMTKTSLITHQLTTVISGRLCQTLRRIKTSSFLKAPRLSLYIYRYTHQILYSRKFSRGKMLKVATLHHTVYIRPR